MWDYVVGKNKRKRKNLINLCIMHKYMQLEPNDIVSWSSEQPKNPLYVYLLENEPMLYETYCNYSLPFSLKHSIISQKIKENRVFELRPVFYHSQYHGNVNMTMAVTMSQGDYLCCSYEVASKLNADPFIIKLMHTMMYQPTYDAIWNIIEMEMYFTPYPLPKDRLVHERILNKRYMEVVLYAYALTPISSPLHLSFHIHLINGDIDRAIDKLESFKLPKSYTFLQDKVQRLLNN